MELTPRASVFIDLIKRSRLLSEIFQTSDSFIDKWSTILPPTHLGKLPMGKLNKRTTLNKIKLYDTPLHRVVNPKVTSAEITQKVLSFVFFSRTILLVFQNLLGLTFKKEKRDLIL